VHALFQSASNLVFGFDLSSTALKGSKGIAQPPHRYCRSQALEKKVETVCWPADVHSASDTVNVIPKRNQRRGSSLRES